MLVSVKTLQNCLDARLLMFDLINRKLYRSAANLTFPRIARTQSFKPLWNVRAAFIGWKVSPKKACVKIHKVWHAIKKYITDFDYMYIHRVNTRTAQIPWKILVDVLYRSKHYGMRNRLLETSGWRITCSRSIHVDKMFTPWYCSTNGSCSKKFIWNHLSTQKITISAALESF